MNPNYGGNYGGYPLITTSGTTVINLGHTVAPIQPPAALPDPSPLDWLRAQVDEVREMARAA